MSNDQNLDSNFPWLNDKDWQNGQIHSGARSAFYLALFFTLFWNAISFPIAFFAIKDTYHDWNIDHLDPVLFVLLFPLVGLILIFQAYKTYRQWSAFGYLSMTLDPYPGSIGGDVGGFVELPVAWRSGYDFKITINCIHHTISRSGKNSSHNQKVVWKTHAAVEYEPSAKGIRLKFKAPVDDDLIGSTAAEGNNYYRWVVRLQGHYKQSDIHLDREFDIPVFKLDTMQTSHLRISASAPEVDVEQIDPKQVQIQQNTRSLELIYPRSRYASMGKGLFIFSLVFLGATGFLGYETWSEISRVGAFSFFSVSITGFMTFVFGLVSLTMLGFAIHLLTSRLEVLIDFSGIKVVSRSFLHNSIKTASLSQLRKISKKSTMSSGHGSSATLYFTIRAQLKNHKTLTLGNGIKGQLEADSLIKLINKQLKSVAVNVPADDVDDDRITDNSVEELYRTFDGVDTEKVTRYIKYFKWFANIIGLVIMLLFLYEFFSFSGFWK